MTDLIIGSEWQLALPVHLQLTAYPKRVLLKKHLSSPPKNYVGAIFSRANPYLHENLNTVAFIWKKTAG